MKDSKINIYKKKVYQKIDKTITVGALLLLLGFGFSTRSGHKADATINTVSATIEEVPNPRTQIRKAANIKAESQKKQKERLARLVYFKTPYERQSEKLNKANQKGKITNDTKASNQYLASNSYFNRGELSLKGLNKNQKKVAKRLIKKCNQLGLKNRAFQAGLLANAYHESGFQESILGDQGHSVGIFQLHTKIGAGRGYSKAYLKNAENNLTAIYAKEKALIDGIHSRAIKHNNPAQVAAEFCLYVERPANRHVMARRRAKSVGLIV